MKIKHIYTNQGIFLLTLLEKWCISHGVSYVRIENEIHFDDYIIFFHGKNDKEFWEFVFAQSELIPSLSTLILKDKIICKDKICFVDPFEKYMMNFDRIFAPEDEFPILSEDDILSRETPRVDVKRGFLDPQNMYPVNTKGYPNIRIRKRF